MSNGSLGQGVGFPAAIGTSPGMFVPGQARVSGDGTLAGASLPLKTYASAARAENATGDTIDTTNIVYMTLDLSPTAFTGGTAPTVTFLLDRQGLDGVWYPVWTSSALNSLPLSQPISLDLGPGFAAYSYPSNQTQHAIFTSTARFRWTFGGTAAPTAVTFSASITGRSN